MADKGIKITLDPEVLLPAVAHTRMYYSGMTSDENLLNTETSKLLEDGVLEGPRMQAQKQLAEAIKKLTGDIMSALSSIGQCTDSIYSNYISIEGQAAIQRVVANAAESVASAGDKETIANAGKQ